jgi:hypothetical protein
MSMNSNEVLERAIRLGWSSFKSSWPLLLVAALFSILGGIPGALLQQVFQIIGIAADAAGASKAVTLGVMIGGVALSQIVAFTLQWLTTAGGAAAAMRAQRGHANDFKALLSGLRKFKSVLAVQFLLLLLATIPWVLLAACVLPAFEGVIRGESQMPDITKLNIPITIVCGLFGIVCSVWFTARFGAAALRAADPDEPPIGGLEALRYSFALTRGRTLVAIGMLIRIGSAVAVSIFLCFVGVMLVGMPLALALQVGFYRALRGEPDPAPAPPPVQWPGAVPPRTPV